MDAKNNSLSNAKRALNTYRWLTVELSCPYYNDTQRKALFDAKRATKIEILRFMSYYRSR